MQIPNIHDVLLIVASIVTDNSNVWSALIFCVTWYLVERVHASSKVKIAECKYAYHNNATDDEYETRIQKHKKNRLD